MTVQDPWSRTYCGGGDLNACRAALWNAMSQAAADLEAEFSSPNVADWKRQIADEDIRHVAVGVTSVPAIEWINRPTFQQVVQIAKGACGAVPLTTCREPIVAGGGVLGVEKRTPTDKDRLLFKWTHGAATTTGDFGDPRSATSYELCLYDGAAGLVSHASAPAGGTCNAASPRPCWRATSTGFRYVDKDLTPNGVQQLTLQSGLAGKSKITLRGRGSALEVPPLPATLPVTAQLLNSDGTCWEAQFTSALRDQIDGFKARSQ
jgi:hypothetical protein